MIISTLLLAATAALSPIREGEHCVYFGDSITYGGWQTDFTQLYWSLRHPGSKTRFYNCGIGGDTAEGALRRVKPDVGSYRPDRVIVMLGMNDAGLGYYLRKPLTNLNQCAITAAHYETNMTKLVSALRSVTKEIVLLTPSPYDEYTPGGTNRGQRTMNVATNYNEVALAHCAKVVPRIAERENTGVIELHRPMTEVIRANPELIIGGYDRIHPGQLGHLYLVATVLTALGEPAQFSEVVFDAQGRGTFAADYTPAGLPFPRLDDYVRLEKFYPFTDRHNVERLVVKNLAPGNYMLKANGRPVMATTAAALAAGVNLATNATPNQALAKTAYSKYVYPMHGKEYYRRDIECVLFRELRTQGYVDGDPSTAEKALVNVEKFFRKHTKYDEKWYARRIPQWKFAVDRRNLDALEAEIESYRQELEKLRPVTWKLEIVPVKYDIIRQN